MNHQQTHERQTAVGDKSSQQQDIQAAILLARNL
jgi:hypothetical protein